MPPKKIIGRENEKIRLEKAFNSKKAEFIAIYGRRRVGKTYLIRQFFNAKKCIFFQSTGIQGASMSKQIKEFMKEIGRAFYGENVVLQPENTWMEAFRKLTDAINNQNKTNKVVIFLDELPWMSAKKNNILRALDYYWNRFWVNMPQVKLIICGSAASWIIKNIINNKGGLHNRITMRFPIEPFSLRETKDFLKSEGINYSHSQILDLYMCIGGIPYYLSMTEKGLSAIQNINQMCFQKKGTLLDEFNNLFSSLFKHSEMHITLVKLIAEKREGISREEIERRTSYKGGRLSIRLEELEHAGFVFSFIPWGRERKGKHYKIIDEYTLFYLNWIAPKAKQAIHAELTSNYWEELAQTAAWKAWAGYAFESICFKHLQCIQKTLNIPDGSQAYVWRYIPSRGNVQEQGTQIDLLFERNDGIINLCEIKYSNKPYKIDKEYAKNLNHKRDSYQKITKTHKQIFISMVTTFGLAKTLYSEDLIDSTSALGDLFKF